MANRYEYDDRERRWRNQDDEGFSGRVRDWFGDREDEDDDRDEANRFNDRGWDQENSRSRYDVNASRGGSNRDNWQRDQGYNRSQQWRQGSGQDMDRYRGQGYNQNRGRNTFGDPYGRNYGTDWDVNQNQGGENTDWDYGYSRRYNRGQDFGRDYNRGYNQDRYNFRDRDMDQGARSGQIYNRDWYDWDFDENFSDENDNIRDSEYMRGSEYMRVGAYNRDRGYNRGSAFNRYQGGMRDYSSRQRFNRGADDYDQMRDYGQPQDYSRGNDFNRSRNYNRTRDYNRDQEYGLGQDYDRNPRYGLGRDYNRDRGFDRSSGRGHYHLYGMEHSPYGDVYDRGNERGDYNRGGYDRGGFELYGMEHNPYVDLQDRGGNQRGDYNRGDYNRGGYERSEDQDWSNQYRTAGMGSDYGQSATYENRAFYDENLDFYRGDVGYDNEGAFYQDMDEPINYEYWEIWEIPGPYMGMGPQNFQRTDERLQENVCERFTNHGRIDASDIEIDVKDGEVTLRGTVPDREMKRLAEDTAENITGVKNVRNEIKVNKPDWSQRGYNRSSGREYDSGQNRDRSWAESSMAGQTNAGEGLTDSGATSLSGMEAATGEDQKRSQVREGMEVIGNTGQVIGRVKEVRTSDFLLDREMARDVYVPFSAIKSVGAQVLLNVANDAVDQQNWEKPNVM